MGMNIKNPETQLLARKLAKLTGESLTQTITEALREKLERVESRKGLAKRLEEIGRECAAHMKEPYLTIDHGDLLYDELGLPK